MGESVPSGVPPGVVTGRLVGRNCLASMTAPLALAARAAMTIVAFILPGNFICDTRSTCNAETKKDKTGAKGLGMILTYKSFKGHL